MEFSVNGAFNATAEIADSANYPGLRLATVQKVPSNMPLENTTSKAPYSWAKSGPAAMQPVGGAGFSWFSATCYFAGRDIFRGLGSNVPIGRESLPCLHITFTRPSLLKTPPPTHTPRTLAVVASDWGGQTVETFSSPDALKDATCGGTVAPKEGKVLAVHDDKRRRLPSASQLWNGMIFPIIHMRLWVFDQSENMFLSSELGTHRSIVHTRFTLRHAARRGKCCRVLVPGRSKRWKSSVIRLSIPRHDHGLAQ